MFKKIWNKIKSAGKWIVEKIKAAGRKVKNFVTEHPEEIKTAVKVAGAAVFVVGFIKGFSNSIKDYTPPTPPTREEKLMNDANDMLRHARFADDPEKAQVYLRNAEILERMSRKEKAAHAEEEIKKAWNVYEKYKDIDAAGATHIYADTENPVNAWDDNTALHGHMYEFSKGYWAHFEPALEENNEFSVGNIVSLGDNLNALDGIDDSCKIDDIFMIIEKKEGDNG